MKAIYGKRIDRDGNVWTAKRGGHIVGLITKVDGGWRHDLASNIYPTQHAALRGLHRILNRAI